MTFMFVGLLFYQIGDTSASDLCPRNVQVFEILIENF